MQCKDFNHQKTHIHVLKIGFMLLDEGDGLVDLEDLGKVMVKAKTNSAAAGDGAPKEMLTTSLRKSLTKQVNNFADPVMFSFGLISF